MNWIFSFKTTLTLLRIIQKNRNKSIIFSFRDILDIVLLRTNKKHSAYSWPLWKTVCCVILRLLRTPQRQETKNLCFTHIFLLMYRRKYSKPEIHQSCWYKFAVRVKISCEFRSVKRLEVYTYMHVYGMSLCEIFFFKTNA